MTFMSNPLTIVLGGLWSVYVWVQLAGAVFTYQERDLGLSPNNWWCIITTWAMMLSWVGLLGFYVAALHFSGAIQWPRMRAMVVATTIATVVYVTLLNEIELLFPNDKKWRRIATLPAALLTGMVAGELMRVLSPHFRLH